MQVNNARRPIRYEPHPVTPERKAELRALGFRIVDAKFAPPGHVSVATLKQAPTPAAPLRKKSLSSNSTES